jgi:hypothetical protein
VRKDHNRKREVADLNADFMSKHREYIFAIMPKLEENLLRQKFYETTNKTINLHQESGVAGLTHDLVTSFRHDASHSDVPSNLNEYAKESEFDADFPTEWACESPNRLKASILV